MAYCTTKNSLYFITFCSKCQALFLALGSAALPALAAKTQRAVWVFGCFGVIAHLSSATGTVSIAFGRARAYARPATFGLTGLTVRYFTSASGYFDFRLALSRRTFIWHYASSLVCIQTHTQQRLAFLLLYGSCTLYQTCPIDSRLVLY